ncbi:MAG: hypothetical protein KDD64_08465 [Bdellovibrionales bacterium]|nr:hypothetical protein [Bdellovibrionales bacterium]
MARVAHREDQEPDKPRHDLLSADLFREQTAPSKTTISPPKGSVSQHPATQDLSTITISGGSPSNAGLHEQETGLERAAPGVSSSAGSIVERMQIRTLGGKPTVFKHITVTLPNIVLDNPAFLTREQEIVQKERQAAGLSALKKEDLWKNRTERSLGVETEGSLVHSSIHPIGSRTPQEAYGKPAYVGSIVVQRSNRIFGLTADEENREKVSPFEQRRRARELLEDLSAAVEIRRHRAAAYVIEDLFLASGKAATMHEANDQAQEFIAQLEELREMDTRAQARQLGRLSRQLAQCFTFETLEKYDLHFTQELGAHQWEAPSRIFSERRSESFNQLEDDLRRNENIANVLAAKYGATSYPTGMLPSRDVSQYHLEHHAQGPRYRSLFRGLMQIADPHDRYPEGYRKTWSVQYFGPDDSVVAQMKVSPGERVLEYEDLVHKKVIRVENITVALESSNTSMQVHVVSPNQQRHLATLRGTDLIAGLVKAQAANASTIFGISTGVHDTRFFGWQGTHPAHCDGVLPDEISGWDAEPLSQISRAIEKLSAVLPIVEGVSKARLRLNVDTQTAENIDAAFQSGKTIWPQTRETPYQTGDGKLVLGSEVRGNSAQPIPELTAAFAAEIDGLAAALPQYLARRYSIDLGSVVEVLEALLPHDDIRQGRRHAERDGVEGLVKWPVEGGYRTTSIRDLWNDELFEVAAQGMREIGYSEKQILRVIGTEEMPGLLREITNFQLPENVRHSIRETAKQALNEYRSGNTSGDWYDVLVEELASGASGDRDFADEQLRFHHNRKFALESILQMVDKKGWTSADIEQFVAHGTHAYGPELSETARGQVLAQFGIDLRTVASEHYDLEHDRLVERSRNGERDPGKLRAAPYRIHSWLESYAEAMSIFLKMLPEIQ